MTNNDVEQRRCDVTDLVRDQCAHCRRLPDPKPTRDVGIWLKARFGGRCVGCDYPIIPGEMIRASGDGYCCTECGSDHYV
jgi:hypothetical protein